MELVQELLLGTQFMNLQLDTAPTLTATASLGDLFTFRYNGCKVVRGWKKFSINFIIGILCTH
jgi:hypothetical protein